MDSDRSGRTDHDGIPMNVEHTLQINGGNQRRDGGNQRRDGGNQRRDSGNQRRDSGNQGRDGENQKMDGGNQRMEGGNKRKDGGNHRRDGGAVVGIDEVKMRIFPIDGSAVTRSLARQSPVEVRRSSIMYPGPGTLVERLFLFSEGGKSS